MLENIIDAPVERSANTSRAVLVEIKALHEFSRLVRTLGTGRWIFRGHGDKDWKLASSLERHLVRNGCNSTSKIVQNAINASKYDNYRASDEMYAIDLFKRHARTKLPNLEYLVEWLAAMQHYGTSTRLLDFTRSIYVALYFALEDRLKKTDAAIYAIHYPDLLYSKTLRDDLVLQQEQLFSSVGYHASKGIDDREKQSIKEFVKYNFHVNRKELQDSLIKLAHRCIEKRDRKIGIIPVNVPGVNERLIAQAGLFLMPRTFTSFSASLSKSLAISEEEIAAPKHMFDMSRYPANKSQLENATLIKIVIPRSLDGALLNMLSQANVSALNLFPGLEGIAKSIKYSDSLYDTRR